MHRTQRRKFIFGAAALSLGQALSSAVAQPQTSAGDEVLIAPSDPHRSITKIIGQRIIVGFTGTTPSDSGVQAVATQILAGEIAGVLLLKRNIVSISQLIELCSFLKSENIAQPPLICIDQEGGAVARASEKAGFSRWASAAEIAIAYPSYTSAYKYYRKRVQELAFAGINFNFAPVVDLNLNRKNPIIGALDRSFSSSSPEVIGYAGSLIRAHREFEIRTCLKHFPGHGSSTIDSHKDLPNISNSWKPEELSPFKDLVNNNLCDSIMIGHLYHPIFSDAPDIPTSLSFKTVHNIRNSIGFDGPIVTDDLQMGAITSRFSEQDAAIRAIRAGSDLLIFSTLKKEDDEIGPRINDILAHAATSKNFDSESLMQSSLRISSFRSKS